MELLGALLVAAVVACEDSTEVAEFFEVSEEAAELADEFWLDAFDCPDEFADWPEEFPDWPDEPPEFPDEFAELPDEFAEFPSEFDMPAHDWSNTHTAIAAARTRVMSRIAGRGDLGSCPHPDPLPKGEGDRCQRGVMVRALSEIVAPESSVKRAVTRCGPESHSPTGVLVDIATSMPAITGVPEKKV